MWYNSLPLTFLHAFNFNGESILLNFVFVHVMRRRFVVGVMLTDVKCFLTEDIQSAVVLCHQVGFN